MSFGNWKYSPPFDSEVREEVFRKTQSGMNRREVWQYVLDSVGAYEEPSDRSFTRWTRGEKLPQALRSGFLERGIRTRNPRWRNA